MYSSMPYHYSPSSRRRNKKPSNKKFMRVFCCHGIDSFVVHILRRPFLLVQKKNIEFYCSGKTCTHSGIPLSFSIVSFFWDEIFENILYWANIIFVPNVFLVASSACRLLRRLLILLSSSSSSSSFFPRRFFEVFWNMV